MAITPPGDLVLDVMRAADPQRAAAATRRLRALADASGGGPAATAWSDALHHARHARHLPPAPGTPDSTNVATPAVPAPLRLGKAPRPEQLRADGSLRPASETPATAAGRDAFPHRAATVEGAARSSLRQAYAGLEGVLIANMLDGMLASGRDGLFGAGLAGSYWKSLLARTVAEQVARAGGLGVADALLRTTPGVSGTAAQIAPRGMTGETT